MEKKSYIMPLTKLDNVTTINAYMAGDNSIPGGGGDGGGEAEGKERQDIENGNKSDWGNLW